MIIVRSLFIIVNEFSFFLTTWFFLPIEIDDNHLCDSYLVTIFENTIWVYAVKRQNGTLFIE